MRSFELSTETANRFGFLMEQFKFHSQRIAEYHKDRYNLSIWSIAGTFGFFGWIISNQSIYKAVPAFAFFLPLVFNCFGLIYIHALHLVIDRHSAFLDFLERDMFDPNHCETEFHSEWQKFKIQESAMFAKPMRSLLYGVWIGMMIVSALVALTMAAGGGR